MTAAFLLCQFFGATPSRLLRGIWSEAVYNPDYAVIVAMRMASGVSRHKGTEGASDNLKTYKTFADNAVSASHTPTSLSLRMLV